MMDNNLFVSTYMLSLPNKETLQNFLLAEMNNVWKASYKGSYQRSAVTIKNHLSENPGITVCLDIHRDAIEPSASEIIKPTAVINGKKAAQIMIISGCDGINPYDGVVRCFGDGRDGL